MYDLDHKLHIECDLYNSIYVWLSILKSDYRIDSVQQPLLLTTLDFDWGVCGADLVRH